MSKLYVVEISPMLRDPGIKIGKFLVSEEYSKSAHRDIVDGEPIPVYDFRTGLAKGWVSFGEVFRVRTQQANDNTETDFLYAHPACPVGDDNASNAQSNQPASDERAAA